MKVFCYKDKQTNIRVSNIVYLDEESAIQKIKKYFGCTSEYISEIESTDTDLIVLNLHKYLKDIEKNKK